MDVQRGDSIKDRLTHILDQIDRATQRSGREPGTVRLVAATKTVSADRIREAIAAGLTIAGENRLQEALPKIEALKGESICWHFIGRLQRRKVRSVVGVFELIQSVDSVELAHEVDRRAGSAGLRQDVLLEVNIGAEPTKAGFSSDALEGALRKLAGCRHVRIRGLMTIPPPVMDVEEVRPYFRRMRELAEQSTRLDIPEIAMNELSMGMSTDYHVAIEEGATMVRVGTALFGTRHE